MIPVAALSYYCARTQRDAAAQQPSRAGFDCARTRLTVHGSCDSTNTRSLVYSRTCLTASGIASFVIAEAGMAPQ
jgi:hypothetical protein